MNEGVLHGPRPGRCLTSNRQKGTFEDEVEFMAHDNPLIKQWLQDLGRAVAEAMAGSSEVTSTVNRIQEQGFSLYLVLDAKENDEDRSRFDLTHPFDRPASQDRPADFKLGGEDVAFLKSLGIDATRTGKKRRS